jgi:hypothetical protein
VFWGLFGQKGESDAHRPTQSGFVFRAFISYRSADRRYASWIHRKLEQYGLPSKLVAAEREAGRKLPFRLGRFFRDRDDAAGSHSVASELEAAISASESLIVVCSPRSAEPTSWVSREIESFRRLRPDGRILAVIAYGMPPHCFPPALLAPDDSGEVHEPLAADMRWHADGRRRSIVKLVAGLLQLDFDKLWRRERRRSLQRLAFAAATVAAGAVATVTAAFVILTQASLSDRRFVDSQVEAARSAFARGDDLGALRSALLALPANVSAPDVPYDRRAEALLIEVLANRALVFRCRLSPLTGRAQTPYLIASEDLPGLVDRCETAVPPAIVASAKSDAGAATFESADAGSEEMPVSQPLCDDPGKSSALRAYLTQPSSDMLLERMWITAPEHCMWRSIRSSLQTGSSTLAVRRQWEMGRIDDTENGYSRHTEHSVTFRKDPTLACVDRGRVCLVEHERTSLVSYTPSGTYFPSAFREITLRDLEGPQRAALSGDGRYLMGLAADGAFEVWDVPKLMERPITLRGLDLATLPYVREHEVDDTIASAEVAWIEEFNSDPATLRKTCRFLPEGAREAATDAADRWWAAAVPKRSGEESDEDDPAAEHLRIGACDEPIEMHLGSAEGSVGFMGFSPTGDYLLALGQGYEALVSLKSGLVYSFEPPNDLSVEGVAAAWDEYIALVRLGGSRIAYKLPKACQAAIDTGSDAYAMLAPGSKLAREFRPLSPLLHKGGTFACGD